jgi:ribonuclease M5
MTPRPKIVPAIVVEGKYDKIRLESVVDAVIIVTGGFQIYRNDAQLALIRHYAETTGVVILTDADAAGFQIRGYLKGAINSGKVYHVYIPGIHGKERRKSAPSAEGLLGVEGIDNETLLFALERAGVFDEQPPARPADITPAVLYAYGLTGAPDCSALRMALLKAMQLPMHLSVKGLCEVLCTVTDAAGLADYLREMLPADAEEADI